MEMLSKSIVFLCNSFPASNQPDFLCWSSQESSLTAANWGEKGTCFRIVHSQPGELRLYYSNLWDHVYTVAQNAE